MIGLVYILRRRPDLSLQEFQGYWRETHGPLVARHSTSLGISRYIQDHMIEDPINEIQKKLRNGPDPYDGMDELWWNYRGEPGKALATPEGKEAYRELVEDERKFVDFSRSALTFVIDVPQINSAEKMVAKEKSTLLKRIGVLRKLPSLSVAEAQLHWRTDHATLIRSVTPVTHTLRYIQLHMIEHPLTDSLRAMRGKMGEPFEGIVTSWVDRLLTAAAEVTAEYKRAYQEIIKDELNFIDLPRGGMWVNKEYVFVDK